MKCLSRLEMQGFIDKEITTAGESDIVQHLRCCENCSTLYRQVIEDKTKIKRLFNGMDIIDNSRVSDR